MRPTDRIVAVRLIDAPRGLSRDEVLTTMVENLVAEGILPLDDAPDVLRRMLGREELGSTAIGQGIAVPHARYPQCDRFIAMIAVIRGRPIEDFQALDGEPVDLVVLMLSPPPMPGEAMVAWRGASIVRALRDGTFLAAVRTAESEAAMWDIIREHGLAAE